jgi:hypothetical protein
MRLRVLAPQPSNDRTIIGNVVAIPKLHVYFNDQRPDTDITVFDQRQHQSSGGSSLQHHHQSSGGGSGSTTLAVAHAVDDEADDEPAKLFSDPFTQMREPQQYAIFRSADSTYGSYEDPMAAGDGGVLYNMGSNQLYVNDGMKNKPFGKFFNGDPSAPGTGN